MLKVSKENRGEIAVLALTGNLDALTAFELKPTIDELLTAGTKHVVFDLDQLVLIDSSGIGAIVSTYKRTRAHGGDTKLAGVKNQPREVFKVLSLDKALEIFPTVADAIVSFG